MAWWGRRGSPPEQPEEDDQPQSPDGSETVAEARRRRAALALNRGLPKFASPPRAAAVPRPKLQPAAATAVAEPVAPVSRRAKPIARPASALEPDFIEALRVRHQPSPAPSPPPAAPAEAVPPKPSEARLPSADHAKPERPLVPDILGALRARQKPQSEAPPRAMPATQRPAPPKVPTVSGDAPSAKLLAGLLRRMRHRTPPPAPPAEPPPVAAKPAPVSSPGFLRGLRLGRIVQPTKPARRSAPTLDPEFRAALLPNRPAEPPQAVAPPPPPSFAAPEPLPLDAWLLPTPTEPPETTTVAAPEPQPPSGSLPPWMRSPPATDAPPPPAQPAAPAAAPEAAAVIIRSLPFLGGRPKGHGEPPGGLFRLLQRALTAVTDWLRWLGTAKLPTATELRQDWPSWILRGVTYGGAIALTASLLLATLPPLLSDASTRAVVNAPIALLTTPIDGELDTLLAQPGEAVRAGQVLARLRNDRIDRATLIGLESQTTGTRVSLQGLRDRMALMEHWIATLDGTLEQQRSYTLRMAREMEREARARMAGAAAQLGEQAELARRQQRLLEGGFISPSAAVPTAMRERAAREELAATQAVLARREAERTSVEAGSYIGEGQGALGALVERRRDTALELNRLRVEETQLVGNLAALQAQRVAEAARLERLLAAEVPVTTPGHVLRAFASPGQRLSAGDTIAATVECQRAFVVGIFSVRQAHRLAIGTRVGIAADGWREDRRGTIANVLPRTTDRVDTGYAVPFPPMERREMYVLIELDSAARAMPAGASDRTGVPTVPCDIGRWVTVRVGGGGGTVTDWASLAWRWSRSLFATLMQPAAALAAE